MRCVTGDDQQKRLYDALPCLPGISLQLDLGGLVQPDTVLQLDLLKLCRCELARVEVFLGHHRRFLDKAIGHRLGQRVIVDDVLERHRPTAGFYEWRGGEFQTEHRLQLVDRTYACRSTIAM